MLFSSEDGSPQYPHVHAAAVVHEIGNVRARIMHLAAVQHGNVHHREVASQRCPLQTSLHDDARHRLVRPVPDAPVPFDTKKQAHWPRRAATSWPPACSRRARRQRLLNQMQSVYAMRLYVLFLFCLACVRASKYYDLYDRGSLQAIIKEKARDNHIMLFTYVANLAHMWRDMAVELCYELNDRKYPYVVLTHDEKSCDELLQFSSERLDAPPTCVLDTVLHKTHGYTNDVISLWVKRYHAASLFAEAGISVTLLDADTVITQDFVPILRKLELEYALIALGEGPINGGLWHLRASNSSSAALWVIKQVERRTTLLEKYKVHDHDRDPGVHMGMFRLAAAQRDTRLKCFIYLLLFMLRSR